MDDEEREELERRAREDALKAPPLTPGQFTELQRILRSAQACQAETGEIPGS